MTLLLMNLRTNVSIITLKGATQNSPAMSNRGSASPILMYCGTCPYRSTKEDVVSKPSLLIVQSV
jgi:hypothetical protein